MKNIWKMVSKKDFIFVACIIVFIAAFSLVEPLTKIKVNVNDDAININSDRYSMKVDYTQIDSIELIEMPDKGTSVNGSDNLSIRTGIWNNETWGEYYVCAIPNATNCVVMHLTDGRTFVFNARSNEYTAELFAQLQSHLAN